MLMAAFSARRPTRDIDLSASGFPNDVAEAEDRVRSIAAIELDDGLKFATSSVRGEEIRDDSEYHGVRVHIIAHLAEYLRSWVPVMACVGASRCWAGLCGWGPPVVVLGTGLLRLPPSCERHVTEGAIHDGKSDSGEASAPPTRSRAVGQGDRHIPGSRP
ncbi:nucleotidyl transferase AbiEii/AbiGii toxin family protein [Acidipropionibacterium virtanenii]|uniref:nucleotidyl transferase AbiEii/AbiGii toxin family protein n=1 Tax=Acidipropionibacterium virtanenii TaxID=2057246 RepID=UPI003CCC4B4D